jgi:4-hydroxybenzoate polyprenyltransferase
VLIGGIGLFCHTVGLTYAAKQEAYNTIGATWPLWVLAVPVVVIALHLNGAVPLVLLAIYVAWGLYALRFFFRMQRDKQDENPASIKMRTRG